MGKRIHCQGCNTYMGEIRDASLRKGMTVYCDSCDRRMRAALRMDRADESSPIRRNLKDILGDWA